MTESPLHDLEVYCDGLGEGGAEFLLLDLLPALRSRFRSVEVIALRGPSGLEERFRAIAPVTRVTMVGMFRRLWSGRAVAHVSLARPQAIASLVVVLRRLLRTAPRARIVCHEQASFQYYTGRSGRQRLADGLFRRLVTYCVRHRLYGYIVTTRARRAELRALLGDAGDIVVIPNSVAATRMARLAASRANRTPSASGETRFFTLSRLHPVKQLHWAVDAVAAMARRYPERRFVLSVCGRGSELPVLERHAAASADAANLRIEFPGFVESLEARARESDFFLFPSKAEGFPVGLTEAALTGITAIATDCPHGPADLAEFFSNVHLASPPTYEQFARTVEQVALAAWGDDAAPDGAAPRAGWPPAEETAARIADFLEGLPPIGSPTRPTR